MDEDKTNNQESKPAVSDKVFPKRWFILVVIIVLVLSVVVYYIGSAGVFSPNSGPSLNSSFVSVLSDTCARCSNTLPGLVYSLVSSQGYSADQMQLYYGSALGNSFIENNSITSLPSAVLPATKTSAQFLNSLVYINLFNLVGNSFVLNTPFASELARGTTYFSILQNRTITAFDIYNLSLVYNTTQSTPALELNLINPMEIITQFNATNLTIGNKTEILFVYSDSPYAAVQSLILRDTLASFGTFSANATSSSRTVAVSQSQYFGPAPLYDFADMGFSSNLFALKTYNLTQMNDATAQKELFQYDQNAASTLNQVYGSFMPFLDIGGKFISVSSMLVPSMFNGLNATQAYQKVSYNSTVGTLFNSAVSFLDAVLCSYAANNEPVCNSTSVIEQEANIESTLSSI